MWLIIFCITATYAVSHSTGVANTACLALVLALYCIVKWVYIHLLYRIVAIQPFGCNTQTNVHLIHRILAYRIPPLSECAVPTQWLVATDTRIALLLTYRWRSRHRYECQRRFLDWMSNNREFLGTTCNAPYTRYVTFREVAESLDRLQSFRDCQQNTFANQSETNNELMTEPRLSAHVYYINQSFNQPGFFLKWPE